MLPEWLWQNNICLINHQILFSNLQVNIYLILLSTCSFSDIVHFLSLILTPTSLNLKGGHLLLSCLFISLDFHLKKPHRKSNSTVQFALDIHATCNSLRSHYLKIHQKYFTFIGVKAYCMKEANTKGWIQFRTGDKLQTAFTSETVSLIWIPRGKGGQTLCKKKVEIPCFISVLQRPLKTAVPGNC